jgi:hypothetical protein
VAVDDETRRWLYVSSQTGEVVRDATRTERTWGWLGAWLHWLYIFRGGPLDGWWADIVITLALAGTVVALAGRVIGLMRWRLRGRDRNGQRTPYTGFMERWHHLLGLVGGGLNEVEQLLLHPGGGPSGLAADHLHELVEAAAGGLQGVASHIGPFPLNGGQQGLKPLPEGGLQHRWGGRLAVGAGGRPLKGGAGGLIKAHGRKQRFVRKSGDGSGLSSR